MSVCYVCNCIIFFTDYERNPGTQNQNLWVPRHRGRRGQQAHQKDKGKGPESRLGVFTISSGLASAGRQIRTDRQSHRQTDRWLSVKPSALRLTLLSDSQTAELILRKSHWRVTRVSCFTGVNNCFPVFYRFPTSGENAPGSCRKQRGDRGEWEEGQRSPVSVGRGRRLVLCGSLVETREGKLLVCVRAVETCLFCTEVFRYYYFLDCSNGQAAPADWPESHVEPFDFPSNYSKGRSVHVVVVITRNVQ